MSERAASPVLAQDDEGFERAESLSRAADLRWLAKAEHWGEWLRFSDVELAEPEQVWMMRHERGRVRFYAKGRGQVGPEHQHVVAATYWAFANGYIDPFVSIAHNLACRAEVAAGGVGRNLVGQRKKNPTPPASSAEASRGDNPAAAPTLAEAT